ncbi:TPA: hypothetical protein NJU61_001493 [Acinetobacter baumannii]|nr:hypothetical protein [Acinetobacter baumannii]
MSKEVFVFSFDNDEDALNTLAKYHQTTIENIRSKWKTLKKLYKEYQTHRNESNFLFAISYFLGPDPLNISGSFFRIFFYHRTGSNGTKSWFSRGLLNSREGISSFVSNINSLFPHLNFQEYESAMLGKDTQKHMSQIVGPFAFYRKKDAMENSYQRSFLNLPEILYDVANNDKVYSYLLKELEPTVVKFWVEKSIDYLESYIISYWELLLGNDERSTDVGRGNNIPSENIVEIITLPKFQSKNI